MYAMLEIAGHVYRVEEGTELLVDLLPAQAVAQKMLDFDKVLLLKGNTSVQVGTPYVKNASVQAELVDREVKGKKLTVLRYRHKTNHHVKTGHRQKYSRLRITKLSSA